MTAAPLAYARTIANRSAVTATAQLTLTLPTGVSPVSFQIENLGQLFLPGAPKPNLNIACGPLASPPGYVCRLPDVPGGTYLRAVATVRVVDCAANPLTFTLAVSPSRAPGGAALFQDRFWCVDRYFFPRYDQPVPGALATFAIANPNGVPARAALSIAGVDRGTYTIPPHDVLTPSLPGVTGEPAVIRSLDGLRLVASLRQQSPRPEDTGFNELPAASAVTFAPLLVLPWYDSRSPTTEASILVGNPSPTRTVPISVALGGRLMTTDSVPPGGVVTLAWPNLAGGPVEIASLNGADLYATLRTRTGDGFDEFMALPGDREIGAWYLPRYEYPPEFQAASVYVANQGTALDPSGQPMTATVEVRVQGSLRETVVVSPHATVAVSYPGLAAGPLAISSPNRVPIVASYRTVYHGMPNQMPLVSFGDVASPAAGSVRRTGLYFPLYDASSPTNAPTILVAGLTPTSPVTGEVAIGGSRREGFLVAPGTAQSLAYPGLRVGPIALSGDVTFAATLRSLLATGLEEIVGQPIEDATLVEPPASAPTPVIPELSPLSLFAGGLLTLAGVCCLRRRR